MTDLDGVIRFFPDARNQDLETRHGLPSGILLSLAFSKELVEPAIRGNITDEEWRERIIQELARRVPGAPAREIVAEWSAFPGLVEQKNLAFMKKASERCRLALLTNATTKLNADLETLGIGDEFDHVINSAEHGTIKPERRIFDRAQELLGIAFSDMVFVDDSMTNVKAARELGIRAHHFTTLTLLRIETKDLLGY